MGIFNRKPKVSHKSAFYNAPVILNGDDYTQLPNPAPNLQGGYRLDPNRVQAPFPLRSTSRDRLNGGSGDAELQFPGPDAPMNQHFKEQKQLPSVIIEVPANGVFVPVPQRGYGWKQGFVPARGMSALTGAAAPVPLLSHPIIQTTVDVSLQGNRASKVLKAPKPHRRGD